MSNAPPFPPAERFGAAMMALIHAIAARYGWCIPKWLIARIENDIRGFVDALSQLAALAREGKLTPLAPLPATEEAKVRRTGGNARTRTPGQRRNRQRPRPTAAIQTPQIPPRPPPPAPPPPGRPWPNLRSAPWPNRTGPPIPNGPIRALALARP